MASVNRSFPLQCKVICMRPLQNKLHMHDKNKTPFTLQDVCWQSLNTQKKGLMNLPSIDREGRLYSIAKAFLLSLHGSKERDEKYFLSIDSFSSNKVINLALSVWSVACKQKCVCVCVRACTQSSSRAFEIVYTVPRVSLG